ncbi:hypothetical protein PV326_000569 [Microctonus aethiopoides]|nr:hypothetical protein PV326_000569 [Microctonus aethiopoides]
MTTTTSTPPSPLRVFGGGGRSSNIKRSSETKDIKCIDNRQVELVEVEIKLQNNYTEGGCIVNMMEHERGRTSRASSTSSLGREVRCACQYFQSDSLLPERRAMMQQYNSSSSRPSSRTEQKPTLTSGVCEHEYEPVGAARFSSKTTGHAPVVRIIDTDVAPVADSDDSIDIRGRFTPGPVLDDDDLVLPLDGQIEDSAMEGKELGSGYVSDEVETAQQLQDRIEERFLSAATPCTESRTDGEVNTSQVDSSAMEELPLRRGARGLPQRLRSQAGKLRLRLKNIQRPNFTFPVERNKLSKTKLSDKIKSRPSEKSSEKSRTLERSSRQTDKRTRMERIRASLPERPKFTLPDRPKFNFPQKSKFHLPQRPKINLPKMPTRSSFRLPTLPGRRQRAPSLGEQQRQHSNESNAGSRKNLFEFATVPRLFNKKKKGQTDYATSSPKELRGESSAQSSTLPRVKKSQPKLMTQRFTDIKFADDDDEFPVELNRPWKHSSLEKPRRSIHAQESLEDSEPLPWEESEIRRKSLQIEELSDNEELDESEIQQEPIQTRISKIIHRDSEDSYEPPQIDPRLYGDQNVVYEETQKNQRDDYRVAFEPVDPRGYKKKRSPSPEEEEEEVVDEEDEIEDDERLSSELEEDISTRSDREQQPSSGSSCDRRRRGVIEEIDSDEFFLRAKGISQDDMHMGQYLTSEIRDALKIPSTNALVDEVPIGALKPPQRPARARSIKKRKESLDSYEITPPIRPKRSLRRSEESDYGSNIHDNDDSLSESRHRIVYHAESAPLNLDRIEPLDDIVVVKPIRRKSRTSLRSSSLVPSEPIEEISLEDVELPPLVPRRRKRRLLEMNEINRQINGTISCNGHHSITKLEMIPRQNSEPPIKPLRSSSRDRISTVMKVDDEEEYIEPAPIAPKRHSRSRATSIIQDDDRTSREAESIPDIGFEGDIEPQDNDSRLDFPGYAIIEKRDKPPRPPPPRRQRGNKFSTTPRPSPPKRPTRAYSTLRPRSRTPSDDGLKTSQERESTPYVEMDSEAEEEDDHKDLRSGDILNKMASRPLPAPPRPPRSRREKITEEHMESVNNLHNLSATEAFASTQTDPLPDDMVIEEEITQAKLIVTPSRSGSQIMVSTERIPSPQHFRSNVQAISHERIPSPMPELFVGSSTRSEPDIRGSRVTPEREIRAPEVPPLPTTQVIYPTDAFGNDDDNDVSQRLFTQNNAAIPCNTDSRIPGIEELEERLSAFLTNETLKISSLEVGDLKVDKLNVSTLEAHKIAASEIDAIVVSATEISNNSQEDVLTIHPSLLQELIAIRSQLELVVQQHELMQSESPSRTLEESTEIKPIISEAPKQDQTLNEPIHLQLDKFPKTTESRSIFSTQGISIQELNQMSSQNSSKAEQVKKIVPDEVEQKQEETSRSPSRSCSPTRSVKRETASPIRSLPPVISVTPDEPAPVQQPSELTEVKPQRATISYSSEMEFSERPSSVQSRPSSPQSRPVSPPLQNQQQYIAFQTSQIPPQFFTLASSQSAHRVGNEPSILDMTQQLVGALRLAGKRAMQHFINYIVSRVSHDESETKIREVELAICALLLIIVGLIIVCFAGPKTITHHHHWDYFNPPRL